MPASDNRIIERVRDGDAEACGGLVARYQSAVYGMAVATRRLYVTTMDGTVRAFGRPGS